MITGDQAQAIARAASAEMARRDLIAFAQRMDGTFKVPPHIERLARLLEAVEHGCKRRVIITLPPRHGKSRLLQLFAAMYLGRAMERGVVRNVITASHSAELAERNSRYSRDAVADDRWPFTTRLSQDSSAQHRWNLSDGSGLYATGVGGGITGRGADLLILDDAQHDESSAGERESTWRWYAEVATPRLEPGGAVVVIATRWHAEDLVGRILAGDDGKEWEHLTLPAIAVEDPPDAIGRTVGEALWPDRFSLDELLARKSAMGSRPFSAQFQQNPLPAEGSIIKAEWLTHRYDPDHLPEFETIIAGLDAAAKTGVSNDYSAIAIFGTTASDYYLLDVIQRRVEFPDLARMVQAAHAKYGIQSFYCEDTSNATALIQQLRRDSKMPIIPVKPKGSKISRVEGIAGLLESGRVHLPREATWLVDFERELLGFPNDKHDDMVDAFTLPLSQGWSGSGFGFSVARNPFPVSRPWYLP